MRKKYKPLLFLFVITVLAIGMIAQASAQTGSITIQLEDGASGTSKSDVSFLCDKVADFIDGEYKLLNDFQASAVDVNKIKCANDTENAAKKLYSYASKKGVCVTTDETGMARFDNLSAGMYLIYIEGTNNYDLLSPTLISVPTWSEQQKGMNYDVVVIPKHSPIPNAPQTGDNSSLFFYCGTALITGLIFIAIISRKEKSRNEKNNKTFSAIGSDNNNHLSDNHSRLCVDGK